ERPRRMLARRPATEILARHQYRRTLITRLVENKRRIVTPVVKKKLPKPRALDAFQKLLRNNLIRINIRAIQRRDQSGMFTKWFHLIRVYLRSSAAYLNFHSLTSVKCPVIAAAAAIIGLTR